MVLIHVKRSEEDQFLFETTCSEEVDTLIRQLVNITNLRGRISRLQQEGEQLAKHGPARPPEDDDAAEKLAEVSLSEREGSQAGENHCADPSERRTGAAPSPEAAEALRKALAEAAAYISKDQVANKVALTEARLREVVDSIREAVHRCFPDGLPAYDPVRQELEVGTTAADSEVDPNTATLWWAGKELLRGNKLSQHVGKNEKTKVVAKLQKKGVGPPSREPPADAETQKAMMAWYFKKQQEEKALAEDDDDAFTNSAWANPKALKSAFSGVGNITWK
ncbi:hypothetical protein KFL_003250040 [Klebsormidium nitens]|uniref:Uncharacterized protein n=1 Tax=Klebsormidium nitens TaxID=105231 RepID=A0A1Y1ID25_KLENI|nr:hypothetical protein KFL_003250040 [Klebsormidium nitens]|eukprot:GAQ87001.1 hypothetical protein KFL_003250040 [Klebsormidium nitens]